MITELVVLSPFAALWYFGFIGWKSSLIVFLIYYWLPKWLLLDLFLETHYSQILTRNKFTKNKIALTFDDVPYGAHEEIIKLLDKYNMKATFFVISEYLTDETRSLLVKAVKNGHQLGNHGKTNSMHALKTTRSLFSEIQTCDAEIKEIYHQANVTLPNLMVYRPGCGLFTEIMLRVVQSQLYTLALGSVYPNDPMIRWSLLNYYYLISHLEGGDVVILHDRIWTIPLLEGLLPWLIEKKYTSVTLNDLTYSS